ncbi:MAG: hypothetical protein SGI83_15660 [Bacteroidota bacterium]|nr:hypothetical protein [Bacteroidota bacterium]
MTKAIIFLFCLATFINLHCSTDPSITNNNNNTDSARNKWVELGTGNSFLNANGLINSICTDRNNNVYAAGNLRNGIDGYYVAKWDATT